MKNLHISYIGSLVGILTIIVAVIVLLFIDRKNDIAAQHEGLILFIKNSKDEIQKMKNEHRTDVEKIKNSMKEDAKVTREMREIAVKAKQTHAFESNSLSLFSFFDKKREEEIKNIAFSEDAYYALMANALYLQNLLKYKEALVLFECALKIRPNDINAMIAYCDLSLAYYKGRSQSEIEKQFLKVQGFIANAEAESPKDESLLLFCGYVYLVASDYVNDVRVKKRIVRESIKYFEKALSINSEVNEKFYYAISSAYCAYAMISENNEDKMRYNKLSIDYLLKIKDDSASYKKYLEISNAYIEMSLAHEDPEMKMFYIKQSSIALNHIADYNDDIIKLYIISNYINILNIKNEQPKEFLSEFLRLYNELSSEMSYNRLYVDVASFGLFNKINISTEIIKEKSKEIFLKLADSPLRSEMLLNLDFNFMFATSKNEIDDALYIYKKIFNDDVYNEKYAYSLFLKSKISENDEERSSYYRSSLEEYVKNLTVYSYGKCKNYRTVRYSDWLLDDHSKYREILYQLDTICKIKTASEDQLHE